MPSLPDQALREVADVAEVTVLTDVAGVGMRVVDPLPESSPATDTPSARGGWQPVTLGSAPAVAASSVPASSVPASSVPVSSSPELFVVSERVGVPAAVLLEAHRVAQARGYAAGFAGGMTQARRRAAADDAARALAAHQSESAARAAQAQALAGLDTARNELANRTALELDGLHQLLLDSAYAIAEAIVGSAVRDDAVRGRAALARVLALAPTDADTVVVRLHPADAAVVASEVAEHITLVADPAITPGDAVAVAGGATVESRVCDALARVREVLA